MQVTITGGTGSLSQYIQKELSGKRDIVLFDQGRKGVRLESGAFLDGIPTGRVDPLILGYVA